MVTNPQPPSQFGNPAQNADPETEASAMLKIRWFGMLQLAAVVVTWVGTISSYSAFVSALFASLPGPGATQNLVPSGLVGYIQFLGITIAISFSIQLASLFYLRSGLATLSRVEKSAFSTPTVLTLLLMIGLVLVAIGLVALFSFLLQIFSQLPAHSPPSPNPLFEFGVAFVALLGFIVVGGILVLVGLIGGQILGLWRVGVRYNKTIIELGAIFAIIPLLSLAAPVLIVIGAHEVNARLRSLQMTYGSAVKPGA